MTDDNPYQAPQVRPADIKNNSTSNPKPLIRDLLLVIVLDALLIGLTHVYDWLITDVWPGFLGIYVTMWLVILVLACTAIGGALIRRMWLGVAGIVIFWAWFTAVETSAPEASVAETLVISLISIGVQLLAFLAA